MASSKCISQTTSHLIRREGIHDKVVSSKCIRRVLTFSVRAFIFCTCSVVYSLLSVHLCRTGRQKQAQLSTLWKYVIAANTNGLAVTTVHFCALLQMLTGGMWQREAEEIGSGILNYGFRSLLGLTSCKEEELENVERTMAGVFLVLDKCCGPKLTIYYPFNPATPTPFHLSNWEVIQWSSCAGCDSKSHSSQHIQHDP